MSSFCAACDGVRRQNPIGTSLLANFGQGAFQLLNPKIAVGNGFAHNRKLFVLLIEQVSAFRGDKIYRRPSSLLYGLGRLRRHPGAEKGDLDACAPERAPTRDSVGTRQRRFVPT